MFKATKKPELKLSMYISRPPLVSMLNSALTAGVQTFPGEIKEIDRSK